MGLRLIFETPQAPAPVVDRRHLGDLGAGVVELEQQLDVGREAGLAHEQPAVGLDARGAACRRGRRGTATTACGCPCRPPTKRKRVRHRLGGGQAPGCDAHDPPARRVDRGQHDVGALVELREHPRQVVEVGGVVGLDGDDRVVVGGLAQRSAQAGVDRGAQAAVDLVAHDGEVEVLAVGLDDLRRAVGRAVVDEDDARAELARPRREVGDQVGDVLALVVGRDDEADHGGGFLARRRPRAAPGWACRAGSRDGSWRPSRGPRGRR